MPKCPQFIRDMKKPPKGPHHGQHRRTSPTAHSDPAQGAGSGYIRTVLPATTWRTLNSPITSAPNPGASGAIDYVAMKAAIAKLTPISNYDIIASEPPKPAPIPYAGIRVGEIIGYRAWLIRDNLRLGSLAHDFIWEPGQVVEGKVDEVISYSGFMFPSLYGGVYAFCDQEMDLYTRQDIAKASKIEEPVRADFGGLFVYSDTCIWGMAIGTITMWGDVVEHEQGYRSSHARLRSIDAAYGLVKVGDLREVYNV